MQTELQKELKNDETDYEKMTCWCEVNNKEKNAAILAYEAKIRELEAEIETREKRAEKLAGAIKSKQEEIASTTQSIASTEEQRAKQNKENQAGIIELTKNIEALKGAVTVLKKHQLTAFPQMKLNFLAVHVKESPDTLDKLDKWMEKHQFSTLSEAKKVDIDSAVKKFVQQENPSTAASISAYSSEEISFLARAKKLVQNFSQGTYAPYANQSGEIFGILRQLLEQMTEDLGELEKKESTQKEEAAALLSELKAQLAAAEEMLMSKQMEAAENKKLLADAKENMEDAETSLDADSKFLKQVIEMCGSMDTHFEERMKTRHAEIAAIGDALKMLTSDDARDLFTSTLGSFLQMRSSVHRQTSRERASSVIIAAGAKAKNAQMVALATQVRLDGFVKVKKAINDMIADLKQQQADEVDHKNFCESELHTNDMDTIAKEGEKKDTETKIATLEESIESLKDEIAATKAALEQTKVELMSASMDRVEQNKAFQSSVADQRATQALLEKVQVRLADFYGSKGALVQAKVKHAQPVPPVQIVEYKNNGGSSPVISMLDSLIHDAAVLEKEAIADENTAQQEYESYVKDSNDSMEAKIRAITNLAETKATSESELEQANTDLKAANSDLESLAKYAADLHSACDFTLKNFDVRQTARAEEVEALQQALAILSGMQ
jgi:hypothetical protein